jgi:putative tryptophan/tyrosine transport system ATP-binding protein
MNRDRTDMDPPVTPGKAMFQLEGVTKIFNRGSIDQKIALREIRLDVAPGDFVTVIGSNGAGKTTLLNVITGSLLVDDGNVVIDGLDVTHLPEHGRGKWIGRVFQNPLMGTAAEMTIEENLSMAILRGRTRGLRKGVTEEHRRRYRPILGTLGLGLETRLKDRVGLLSGGQRQSLALLMATLTLPRLLLLDEHTASLDPKTAAVVMDLTDRMVRENRLTTLMVTHNMDQAIRYGNRLIMMHEGRIVLDVAGEEKRRLTLSEVVERFGIVDEELLLKK